MRTAWPDHPLRCKTNLPWSRSPRQVNLLRETKFTHCKNILKDIKVCSRTTYITSEWMQAESGTGIECIFFLVQFCSSCSSTVVNFSSNNTITEIKSSSLLKDLSIMKAGYYHCIALCHWSIQKTVFFFFLFCILVQARPLQWIISNETGGHSVTTVCITFLVCTWGSPLVSLCYLSQTCAQEWWVDCRIYITSGSDPALHQYFIFLVNTVMCINAN